MGLRSLWTSRASTSTRSSPWRRGPTTPWTLLGGAPAVVRMHGATVGRCLSASGPVPLHDPLQVMGKARVPEGASPATWKHWAAEGMEAAHILN